MPDNKELLAAVASTLTTLPYETWNFGDSVAFEAMIEAAEHLDDASLFSFAHGWARAWSSQQRPFRRLDCTAPGLALTLIAEKAGDSALLVRVVELARYLRERPRLAGLFETWVHSPLMLPYGGEPMPPSEAALLADPPPGVFLDCMHFDPPFFAALGRVTEDADLIAEAVDQQVRYIDTLQREDGLFQHFVLRGQFETFGPGWGRGQGWALLGMLDVLDQVAATPLALVEPHAESIEKIRGAAHALVLRQMALQRADGHWWAVVDNPQSGEEFSTAAFMAAGFYRAIRQGIVTEEEAREPAERAVQAIVAGVDGGGRLREVSAAVMACTVASHYAHVPRGFVVPWGQGPAVLALIEAARRA